MRLQKTILSMLICISLVLTSFGTVLAAETPQVPQVDESGTYLIGTADELFAFAETAKSIDGKTRKISARLTADIDLNPGVTFSYDPSTGYVTVKKGDKENKIGTGMKGTVLGAQVNGNVGELGLKKWTPIGTDALPYIGSFDGNGHTIDGLYINDENIVCTGLFGLLSDVAGNHEDSELKNLTIGKNSLIVGYNSSKDGATGAFAGKMGFSTVSNCTNYATVVGKGNDYPWTQIGHYYNSFGQVGGITGLSFGRIQNCVNRGTIVSLESAGGIAGNVLGYNDRDSSVASCVNYGNVYAGTEENKLGSAGGIAVNVGCRGGDYQFTKPVEACMNFGDIEGGKASGIVQTTSVGAADKSILYCANRGKVSGSLSAAGIVDYIDNKERKFVMEGCYNAGVVSMLSDNTARKAYPIASSIYINSTTGGAYTHTIKDCYNDKTVCPAEDNELFGAYITATDCFSVTTELFETGKPAYEMGSFDKNGWKQNIPTPSEEGKTPETYPSTDGTRRVYEVTHYCCHTDSDLKENHKTIFYSNAYGDITDEHDPDANGICSHCGKDTRPPIFLADTTPPGDTLPEAKAGEYYDRTIRVNEKLNENIKATVSETDDTQYTFTNGLAGTAGYYRYGEYYYYNISGTPTEAGTLTFTLSATNENGTTKKTFTLKINAPDPLKITSDSRLPNAIVGQEYGSGLFDATTHFDKEWSLAKDSVLPGGLELEKSKDGECRITGIPTTAGDYTFKVVVTAGGQTAEQRFTLKVFDVGGCKHEKKITIKGITATCQKDGIAEYYHCNICDCDIDDNGNEINNTDELKTASNHSDKNNDGKCDFCGKNMPVFKKVMNDSGVVYGGTYVFITKIDNEYYALAIPQNSDDDKSKSENNFMNVCEVTPDGKGDFTFNSLENSKAMMLKTEFAAERGFLDAGQPRYGISSVFNNKRYSLWDDGDYDPRLLTVSYGNSGCGYRITFNESGEALIGSVYNDWWSDPKKADKGLLRAFAMTIEGNNTKFMSLWSESDYKSEDITEYPIYLYRMTDVGSIGGTTFTVNDANCTVDKGNFELDDMVKLSNTSGIANAVEQAAVTRLIDEIKGEHTSVTAQIYAELKVIDTDPKISVTYSVTPKIDILDENGAILVSKEISNDDLNGMPITVTLFTDYIDAEQIIHYKKDGTKEYFYAEGLKKAENGAKKFEKNNYFVSFEITDFSEIKILAAAEPEDNVKNSISCDGKTVTATVDTEDNYTVVFAGYDNDVRLSYMVISEQSLKAGENSFAVPETVDISKVSKILLWKGLSSMQPMCGPFRLDLK